MEEVRDTKERVELLARDLKDLAKRYMDESVDATVDEQLGIDDQFFVDTEAVWLVAQEFGLEPQLEAYLLEQIRAEFSAFEESGESQQFSTCGGTCETCGCSRDADRAECEQEGMVE